MYAAPKPFLEELDSLLIPLMNGTGTIPPKTAQRIVGKAGRLSQVVKEARPFTSALYAAYSASAHADRIGPREAGPGLAPCSRFATAARWVHRLISGNEDEIFPLQRLVSHLIPPSLNMLGLVIQVDASLWGTGAAPRKNGKIVEYWATPWRTQDVVFSALQPGQQSIILSGKLLLCFFPS